MGGPVDASDLRYEVLSFDQLDGWEADDHAAALSVFRNTCNDMKDPDWDRRWPPRHVHRVF